MQKRGNATNTNWPNESDSGSDNYEFELEFEFEIEFEYSLNYITIVWNFSTISHKMACPSTRPFLNCYVSVIYFY